MRDQTARALGITLVVATIMWLTILGIALSQWANQ